jgi:hypothetical protein
MNARWFCSVLVIVTATWLLGEMFSVSAQSTTETGRPPTGVKADDSRKSEVGQRVTVEVARERADMLHLAYAASLETIHRHYFRKEQPVLPARAMEEVFSQVGRKSNVTARWISVNTKPMSVEHEPEGEFEKKAARELAAGKQKYEAVDHGYFRSASSISLGGGCLNCHAVSAFGGAPKGPRYAGLVISVPIQSE